MQRPPCWKSLRAHVPLEELPLKLPLKVWPGVGCSDAAWCDLVLSGDVNRKQREAPGVIMTELTVSSPATAVHRQPCTRHRAPGLHLIMASSVSNGALPVVTSVHARPVSVEVSLSRWRFSQRPPCLSVRQLLTWTAQRGPQLT